MLRGCIMLCLVSLPALAGVTLVTERLGQTSKVFVEGNKARLETSRAGHPVTLLFDGDAQKLTLLDDTARTFRVVDALNAQAPHVADADARMKAALANMPPDQRKMIEERMGASGNPGAASAPAAPAPISYQKLGETKRIAGFSCTTYREIQNEKPKAEGCFITWAAAGLTPDDFQALKSLGEFTRRKLGTAAGGDESLAAFSTAPGIPAERNAFEADGRPATSQRLISLSKGHVTADKFEIPAGYAQQGR